MDEIGKENEELIAIVSKSIDTANKNNYLLNKEPN
jgi:hypothetical protein